MANKNQTSVVKTISELSIVNKIMAFLKLDEAGKIEKFFLREIKKIEGHIRDLKNNRTAITNMYDSEVSKLEDAIEDAKEGITNAEQAVTESDVRNNESCDSFSVSYWSRIENAERKFNKLQEELKARTEEHEKNVKEINEQIAKYEARIARIKA